MSESVELSAAGSPEARAALERMLVALQAALRRAMAGGPAAAGDAEMWADLDRAYAAYDAYLALVTAAHPTSCARGCDACCRDNPRGVAGVELLRVARALRAEGRAEGLRGAFAAAAAAYGPAREAHGEAGAGLRQRALQRPCPMLDPAGGCSVYLARPVACRMFYALTPAAWCAPEHPRFAERQNPNLVPPLVCRQLLGAISHCLGLPGSTNLWEGMHEVLEK